MSRKDTLRRGGHIWQVKNKYEYEYSTSIEDNNSEFRFHAFTWKFGNIHQAKVMIDHNHIMNSKSSIYNKYGNQIGICLSPGKTVEEAMNNCINWINQYKKNGPQNPQQLFQDCWDHWPTLYPMGDRVSVISQIFFTIGGGYSWLDGAIICTTPDDWIECKKRREEDEKFEKLVNNAEQVVENPNVYQFFPVSENYSNICFVPDNVSPEWLKAAYEAAVLLRDKSGVVFNSLEDDYEIQERNRRVGAKVVSDLEKRFPSLPSIIL